MKAALLAGRGAAARYLPHGGVVVSDDGDVEVVPAGAETFRCRGVSYARNVETG